MAILSGTGQSDTLPGSAGDDIILGRGGADLLVGLTGHDVILGGGGADTIWGENSIQFPPRDGPGPFLVSYDGNLIFGGAGGDLVYAGLGPDTIFGGAGDDTLYGALGGSGFNQGEPTFFNTHDGADLIDGGAGRDFIDAGSGDDTLLGGAGDDTLNGALGADVLIGGPGHDVFLFYRVNTTVVDTPPGERQRDVIVDFHQGEDLIDLGFYISPTFGAFPRPDPVFLGTNPFRDSDALQVRYDIEGDRTVVQFFSTLGPGPTPLTEGPTGEIELAGRHHLACSDFLLGP